MPDTVTITVEYVNYKCLHAPFGYPRMGFMREIPTDWETDMPSLELQEAIECDWCHKPMERGTPYTRTFTYTEEELEDQ